ncbi:unnamed protein product, partial [Vitis vinifera]
MDQRSVSPHVLILPSPLQGNVNSMLKLAELLCLAGIQVTFLNCHYPHHCLLSYSNVQARFSRYPGFRFETISDGLPMEHPRTAEQFLDIVDGVKTTTAPLFMEMMISWCRSTSDTRPPLTCIMADQLMSFATDVANEVGLPIVIFCAISACSFWAYFSFPQLIEAGEVPITGDDMDRLVVSVPGMEGFLRRRDLPSSGRVNDVAYPGLQHLMKIFRQAQRAHALVINTFDDLEGPVLSQIRDHYPRTYAVGPLHAHLKSKLASETSTSQSSNSFREEDKSCILWLDRQPPKSVIYVSFGSLAIITKDELREFWHGLVNSGSRFLWVIRPDALVVPPTVTWAYQLLNIWLCSSKQLVWRPPLLSGTACSSKLKIEMILMKTLKHLGEVEYKDAPHTKGYCLKKKVKHFSEAHAWLSLKKFLSTLKGITAGVPMICWPRFADQQINSRFMSHVWKLGIDMKDTCDRIMIEKMHLISMEISLSSTSKAKPPRVSMKQQVNHILLSTVSSC